MSAVLDCAVFRTVVQLLTCGLVTCVLKNSECIKKNKKFNSLAEVTLLTILLTNEKMVNDLNNK